MEQKVTQDEDIVGGYDIKQAESKDQENIEDLVKARSKLLIQAKQKIAEQRAEILNIESQVNTLKKNNEKSKSEAMELRVKFDKLKDLQMKREQDHSKLRDQKRKLEQELESCKTLISEMKQKNDSEVRRQKSHQEKFYELQLERDRLQQECSQYIQSQAENLSRIHQEIAKNLQLSSNALRNEHALSLSEARMKLLEQEVSLLQPRLEKNLQTYRESEKRLRRELDDARSELERSDAMAKTRAAELDRTSDELTEMQKKYNEAIEEWTTNIGKMQLELCKAQAKLADTERANRAQERQLRQMEKEHDAIEEEGEMKKSSLDKIQEELDKVNETRKRQELRISKLKKELEEAREDSMAENLKMVDDRSSDLESSSQSENPRATQCWNEISKIEATQLYRKFKSVIAEKVELEKTNAQLSSKNYMLERHIQDLAPVEQRQRNDLEKLKRDLDDMQVELYKSQQKEQELEYIIKDREGQQKQMERDMRAFMQVNEDLQAMLMNQAFRLARKGDSRNVDPFWSRFTNVRELVRNSTLALTRVRRLEGLKQSFEEEKKEMVSTFEKELAKLKMQHQESVLAKHETDQQIAELIEKLQKTENSVASNSFIVENSPSGKLRQLDRDNNVLQLQLDNVREQLIDCMNEKLELQKEIRSLGSELSVQNCKLEIVKNEQNKTEILLKNTEDKIVHLKKDLHQKSVEAQREAQENDSLRDKMRMSEDLIRQLEQNEEDHKRKLKEKELKLTTMQNYYKSPATIACKLPNETKQLREQLKTWMSTKDSNLQKALGQVSMLDKERQTLLRDLSKARVEIEKLKGVTQTEEKLAGLDAKIQTTSSEIDYREFLRKLLKPEFESLKRVVLESRQNGMKETDSDLPDLKDALVIDRMTAEENLGVSGRWKQQYEAATREVKNTKAKLEETKKIVLIREKELKREQMLNREHMARSKALLLKKKNELELSTKEIRALKARELSLLKSLGDVTQKLRSEQEQFEKGKANVKQYEADMASLVNESIALRNHTEQSVRTCKEIKQRWIDELCGHTQDINRLKEVEKELKQHTEKIASFQEPGEKKETIWKIKCEELEFEVEKLRTNLGDLQSEIDSKHEEWIELHKAFTNVQELYKESKRDRDRHQELTSAQTTGSSTASEVLNDGPITSAKEEWKKKISDLEDRLRAKTREVVKSNEQLAILQGKLSNNRLMIQKQLNLQKIQELEMQDFKEMQQKVKRIGIIESSNLELRGKCELLEETLANERTKRNELKQEIEALKAENVKMKSERSGLLVKMEYLQEEIHIFESRNEVMVKKYRQIDPAIYQSMRSTINLLRTKLTELSAANTQDLNTKNIEIKNFRDEQKTHKEIITKLEQNIAGLDSKWKDRFSKQTSASSQSSISNQKLSADLKILRGALGKAQNQIRKVTVKQGPHMEVLLKRNNELIDVVSQARHIIFKLESDLERLQGGDQESAGRLAQIEGVEQLSENLESWRKQAVQSKIAFKELSVEVERLKKEMQCAKERIETLVEDLKNAEATGDAVRIQLEATQKEAEGERLRGNTLLLRVKNLEKKLACLDTEKEELRREMQMEITTLEEQLKELIVKQADSQTLIAELNEERDKLLAEKAEKLHTQEQGGDNQVNEDIEQAKEGAEEHANEDDEVAIKNITHHKRTREEAFHHDETVDVEDVKFPPAKKVRIGDVLEEDYMQEDVPDEEDEDEEDQSASEQEQEDDDPELQEAINDEVVEDSMTGQNELLKENEGFVDIDLVEQKEDAVDSLEPYISREPSTSRQPRASIGEEIEDVIAETESEEIEENAQGDDCQPERIVGDPANETPLSKSQSLVPVDTEEFLKSTEQEEGDKAADHPHISEPEDPEDLPPTLVSTKSPFEIGKTPIDEEEEVEAEEPESADSQAESEEGSEIEERTEMDDGEDDEDSGEEGGQL